MTTWIRNAELPNPCTIASFDPGRVNFAIRVETRENNIPTSYFYERREFSKGELMYIKIIEYLDSLECLSGVNLIIVERQMSVNTDMMRVYQTLITYFFLKHPTAGIVSVTPRFKTKHLSHFCDGTRSNLKYVKGMDIKKWSIEAASSVLIHYGDIESHHFLSSASKKDDLADVVSQIEAVINSLEGFKC